jgi:uncharacterized protein (DUF3820 family)
MMIFDEEKVKLKKRQSTWSKDRDRPVREIGVLAQVASRFVISTTSGEVQPLRQRMYFPPNR